MKQVHHAHSPHSRTDAHLARVRPRQQRSSRIRHSSAGLRLSLGVALFGLASTATAVVPEDLFMDPAPLLPPEAAAQAQAFSEGLFVPQRSLQVETQDAQGTAGLLRSSASALRTQIDKRDGSTILREGQLPLHLAAITVGGVSALEHIKNNFSLAPRSIVEAAVVAGIQSAIAADPSLRLGKGYISLDTSRSYFSPEFTTLSFKLFLNGKEVQGAEITARFRDGQWIAWQTETYGVNGSNQVLSAQQKVSLADEARRRLGPAFNKISNRRQILLPSVDSTGQGYLLEPAQVASITDTQGQLYTLTVSEYSGQVLEFYAHKYNFEGKISGSFYSRHPNTEPVVSGMPYISVRAGTIFSRRSHTADKDGNLIVPGQSEVVLKLMSPIVRVANSTGTDVSLTATGDALFNPEEAGTFGETTTFFHTTVINDWTREVLANNTSWLDAQLTATVNINSSCNAYYNGSINFFNSGSRVSRDGRQLTCNNTGEIADVVYHEWGHGLDDNTGGIADGAFSEGIGDIVSMLITNSPEVGPYFIADGSPVRNLDDEYQYPPQPSEREVHKEGLIIGSTWYHLTQLLIEKYGMEVGRDTARRLFLPSLYTSSRYTQQYAAILALDAESDGSRGPNFCLINAAFARHGLAEEDTSCSG
jgi:hypothetical protein